MSFRANEVSTTEHVQVVANDGPASNFGGHSASPAVWKKVVAKYQKPSLWRSGFQLVNSLVPYGLLWFLLYRSMVVSYWITLPLAILAGGFLTRLFIIHHDCGHGSFFKPRERTTSSDLSPAC